MAPGVSLSFLSTLHCPYCGFALGLSSANSIADAVDYGILRCACHEYPIVGGIPILQQIEGLDRVVEYIRALDSKRALLHALNVFRVRWAHRSRWHQVRYHLNCRRVVSDTTTTFEDAARLLRRPKVVADYLIHRYANPSFLAAVAPLMLLGHLERRPEQIGDANHRTSDRTSDPHTRVLDLACGAGHASFLMQLLYPGLSVVSADQDFVSLYLAKRFIAPDATHLCWDAHVPSPFPDHCFDAVFCLDAFHYFRSKTAVVAELKRIMRAEAFWLFPHLHNSLQHNIVAGIPLSPEQYLECFGFREARIFDEIALLLGLSQRRLVDLGTEHPLSKLNESQTLTYVRGGRDVWQLHDGFPSAFCRTRSTLLVNPIYRGRWHLDNLELELVWPNELIRNECSAAETVLPPKLQIGKSELRQLRQLSAQMSTADWDRLGDLVARFVLVPLPPHYSHNNLTTS